jgi:nucleoid DNA-binding protein/DNA-directed RNA polymerase subunit RPC12/RpoP
MNETYTKIDLVKELATSSNISRKRVEAVLDTLTQIAYREARKGFAVPGICRLDVIHRKARQVRNPQTGQTLLIAEHDALRVRAVKRAKDAVAPTPRALVQIIPAPAAAAPVEAPITPVAPPPAADMPKPTLPPPVMPSPSLAQPPPKAAAPTPPPPAAAPADEVVASADTMISFRCKQCAQEIEAPLEMVGNPNECPTCGEGFVVPYMSDPGTIWYRAPSENNKPAPPPDEKSLELMKGRTIRIELPDDF